MKIECLLHREGGTIVEMPGRKKYHFAPQDDGRHIAEVEIESHIERFLSIPDAYRLARSNIAAAAEIEAADDDKATDEPPAVELGEGETLLGSSSHPATFEIEGKTYQLGEIVRRAFTDSGLTVINWNELPDESRELKIDMVLDGIADGEITDVPSLPPPGASDEAKTKEALAAAAEHEATERALLTQQYQEKFGRSPGNMRTETIKAKLAEGQA